MEPADPEGTEHFFLSYLFFLIHACIVFGAKKPKDIQIIGFHQYKEGTEQVLEMGDLCSFLGDVEI